MPAKKKTSAITKPQEMVSFGTAVANFWKKYGVFSGTAQRSEYWWAVLFLVIVNAPFQFVFSVLGIISPEVSAVLAIFFFIPWLFATLVPSLSLTSRRLHDAGFSAGWIFAPWLISLIIWPFVLLISILADDYILLGAFAIIWYIVMSGFGIFTFIITLLSSKLKNNPYRN